MQKTTKAPRAAERTEEVFLDAAEKLFSEHGYEGTSIRAISTAAGANLGALHYYWGSKQALFKAVCERRLRPVVEERLRRFDQCVAKANGGPPDLSEVLAAALVPSFTHDREHPERRVTFRNLLARTTTDPSPEVKPIMGEILDEASFRFVRLLRQCCPHLDEQAFYWRLHGVFGMIQHANASSARLDYLSHGKFREDDAATGIAEIVQFLTAGMSAPAIAAPAPAPAPRTRARAGAKAVAGKPA